MTQDISNKKERHLACLIVVAGRCLRARINNAS
jgi:hypothetical protein